MDWCNTCSGTGHLTCGRCWAGQTRCRCPQCSGKGTNGDLVCESCHGVGFVTPKGCIHCSNSLPCPDCGKN